MIRRPQVRLAVTENTLVPRIRRAMEGMDLEFEILVEDPRRSIGSRGAEDVSDPLRGSTGTEARLDDTGSGVIGSPGHGGGTPARPHRHIDLVPLHLIEQSSGVVPGSVDEAEEHLAAMYLHAPSVRELLARGRIAFPVLVLAEPGAGAAEVARAIHARHRTTPGPFVALSGRTDPNDFERGIKAANRGTLFIEAVECLPHEDQRMLVNVVRDGVLRRGNAQGVSIDALMIATTHANLEQLQRAMEISDLLSVFETTVEIPSLRDRVQDLQELVGLAIEHFRDDLARPEILGFDSEAQRLLQSYSWPGNVAELAHVVEQSIVATAGEVIRAENLPAQLHQRIAAERARSDILPTGWETMSLREVREAATAMIERSFLDRLLARTTGRIGETAKLAGISPRALYDRMRKHDLRKEDYKRRRRRG
jgi:DNA-binding NtrC family response regulator